jgi:hypothetical protein
MGLYNEFKAGVDALYEVGGVDAVYTDKNGNTSNVVVIVDYNISEYGDIASVNKAEAAVSVRLSDVADRPLRGETFTIDGTTYRVDNVTLSDELEHTVLIA